MGPHGSQDQPTGSWCHSRPTVVVAQPAGHLPSSSGSTWFRSGLPDSSVLPVHFLGLGLQQPCQFLSSFISPQYTLWLNSSRIHLCYLQLRTVLGTWVFNMRKTVWIWTWEQSNELGMMVMPCFSHVLPFVTPWTVSLQAPLSIGFSRQEYWSGLEWVGLLCKRRWRKSLLGLLAKIKKMEKALGFFPSKKTRKKMKKWEGKRENTQAAWQSG